jgi:hypothetical protein
LISTFEGDRSPEASFNLLTSEIGSGTPPKHRQQQGRHNRKRAGIPTMSAKPLIPRGDPKRELQIMPILSLLERNYELLLQQ